MTQTELEESDMLSTLHMQYLHPRVTNCCPFCSTISRFQDIAHFRIFQLNPMLKYQSATKFLIFEKIAQTFI